MELVQNILTMDNPPNSKKERLTLLVSHLADNLLSQLNNPMVKILIAQLDLEARLEDSFHHLQESNVINIVEQLEEVLQFVKDGDSTDSEGE
jgi:hypothetical protein